MVLAAIGVVMTACDTSTPPTTTARGATTAEESAPTANDCERWLRDDVIAPDLAAALAAVRAKLDRDFPTQDYYVLTDHATPPRIRVNVTTDHREEIEAAARSVLDPKMVSRLMVEFVRADPQSSINQLLAQVHEFLKTGPVPLTEMTMSMGIEVIIELNSETHACELANALAQRFPADPVFIKVWPPASLAEEGKDFFGTWLLSDPTVAREDRLRLELSTDGSFQMRDYCNYKSGRWAIEDKGAKTVVFRDVAITLMACPSRPDALDAPRRAHFNAAGELLVEQATGRPLTYTR